MEYRRSLRQLQERQKYGLAKKFMNDSTILENCLNINKVSFILTANHCVKTLHMHYIQLNFTLRAKVFCKVAALLNV